MSAPLTGIASDRSIASGIAEAVLSEGAELAFLTRTTSSRREWKSRRRNATGEATHVDCGYRILGMAGLGGDD